MQIFDDWKKYLRSLSVKPSEKPLNLIIYLVIGLLVLAACAPPVSSPAEPQPPSSTGDFNPEDAIVAPERDYRIVTLLPRDAIPAIDDPVFLTAEAADEEYAPEERVLGVVFNGEARAYSVNLLSSHEIVNDEIGDIKFAVTW